jgi:hypothetical protein
VFECADTSIVRISLCKRRFGVHAGQDTVDTGWWVLIFADWIEEAFRPDRALANESDSLLDEGVFVGWRRLVLGDILL